MGQTVSHPKHPGRELWNWPRTKLFWVQAEVSLESHLLKKVNPNLFPSLDIDQDTSEKMNPV
jgi:hypothetical protein